jgi:nucleoid-associated protein YgaU
MQRRSKIIVIALVACLGCGAAYFFRKRGPSSADVLNPAPQAAFQAEAPRHGPEKPAPQSHLLGEIQAADQPIGSSDMTPVAPAGAPGPSPAMPADPFSARSVAVGGQSLPPAAGAAQPMAPGAFTGSASNGLVRHRIVDGDTLTGLAERYLGNSNRFLEIYDQNRDMLTSPDLLPIGSELKIPARGLIAPPTAPDDPQPMVPLAPVGQSSNSADARGARTYVVRRNDTLTGIAKQVYGDTSRYPELLEANRQQLSRPEDLRVGTRLIIP